MQRNVNKKYKALINGGPHVVGVSNLPDKSDIENILMELQYGQGCRMQFAKDGPDACEWIGNIAKEIAVIPEQ